MALAAGELSRLDVRAEGCTPRSEAMRRGKTVLWRYAREHKQPLPVGELPEGCETIEGGFWGGSIARHDRARLRAAVWAALATRLLR